MLPVELRVKQLKLNLVYNVVNDRAPRYLSDSINVTCKQHGINTKSSTMCLWLNLVLLHMNTSMEGIATEYTKCSESESI